jgi:Arc/MetJ-type ribon-helix-helix transcriptional regulator
VQNDKVTIKIPRRIYEKIQHLIGDSGFNSATDFIVYVLRDVLSEQGGNNDGKGEFSPEELKLLKQKLRNLGYLD